MERKLRADAKKKRQDREKAKRESMKPAFETSLLVLDKCQHPNEFLAKQGKTYGDYFRFIPKNSKNMKKAIDMAAKMEGKV